MAGNDPKKLEQTEDLAFKRMREKGYRITMPRVQVVRALISNQAKPLSAYAIHDWIITHGGKIDVVSVYRITATLIKVGLAAVITKGNVEGYVFTLPDHHYLFVVAEADSTADRHVIDDDNHRALAKVFAQVSGSNVEFGHLVV